MKRLCFRVFGQLTGRPSLSKAKAKGGKLCADRKINDMICWERPFSPRTHEFPKEFIQQRISGIKKGGWMELIGCGLARKTTNRMEWLDVG